MFKRTMLPLAFVMLYGGVMMLMSACNATAGAGKDISKAGQAIEDSAEAATPY
jgi:predicted small secreted protein